MKRKWGGAAACAAVLAAWAAWGWGCAGERPGRAEARVRVALCQTSPRRGDVAGNAKRALARAEEAAAAGGRIVVFPEFSFVAVEDLLEGREVPNFEDASWGLAAFGAFAGEKGCWAVVNHPRREEGRRGWRWNETLVLGPKGGVEAVYRKQIPAMVDEYLGMEPGMKAVVAEAAGLRLGLMVCKDASSPQLFAGAYGGADAIVAQFAHVLLERGRASRKRFPFFTDDPESLEEIEARCQTVLPKPLLLVDQTGPGPGWRMAGGSCALDGEKRRVAQAGGEECVLFVDFVQTPEGKWRIERPDETAGESEKDRIGGW